MCKTNCLSFCSSWIRPILILLYTLFVIIFLPTLIFNTVKDGFTKKDQLVLIGGLFVGCSFPICIWHIMQHVLHFTKPKLQKPIIRILWMVPIYAINAWFGMIFPQHSFYLNSIRECYEAYVIYSFMVYLLNFLNLEMDLEASLEFKPAVNHVFPLCCMQPWVMGREFVHKCKHGVLQYTVIRPILTFISIVTEWNGVYDEGTFKTTVAYPYVVAINNVSQFTAMYCLVLFYRANKAELKPMRPLPKFLCIKAVVFFSFFQGVIINFLVYFGYIKNIFKDNVDDNDYKNLSIKLQDFLICIEMFIAALAHKYSFPHEPYHINIPGYGNERTWANALTDVFSLSDVQEDVTEHLGVLGSSLSRRLRGRTAYNLTPGISESEHLMATSNQSHNQLGGYQGSNYNLNSASDSDGSNSTATASTTKNRYGAFDAKGMSQSQELGHGYGTNDGINIVKQSQNTKDYTPQYGVPKIVGNYFAQQELPIVHQQSQTPTTSSRYDARRSSRSEDAPSNSASTGPASVRSGPMSAVRKSDSMASDWLSTPTDEFMGIDVKGLEKDRINYKSDPRI